MILGVHFRFIDIITPVAVEFVALHFQTVVIVLSLPLGYYVNLYLTVTVKGMTYCTLT